MAMKESEGMRSLPAHVPPLIERLNAGFGITGSGRYRTSGGTWANKPNICGASAWTYAGQANIQTRC